VTVRMPASAASATRVANVRRRFPRSLRRNRLDVLRGVVIRPHYVPQRCARSAVSSPIPIAIPTYQIETAIARCTV
jgi:hypothetical protein